MKKYEKTLLKIDTLLFHMGKSSKIEKVIVKNLYDSLNLPFNKPKPYRGDYYACDETENQNCC